MKNNPTERQLHDLLFACEDRAGDHVLWVNCLGDVQITLLTQETSTSWAARMEDQIQFRYKAYEAGNDLVGQNAAVPGMRRLRLDGTRLGVAGGVGAITLTGRDVMV